MCLACKKNGDEANRQRYEHFIAFVKTMTELQDIIDDKHFENLIIEDVAATKIENFAATVKDILRS
jgi:hypothetical protein